MELELNVRVLEMTDEEYVELIKDKYLRIRIHNGVLWKEVAPFFWRPVFHYLKYDKLDIQVPDSFHLGGFQYPITEERNANSTINYYIFNDVLEYDISRVSRNERKRVLHSMKYLEVKIESDVSTFNEKSYPVYKSFYNRSAYKYKRERVRSSNYTEWVNKLFESGKTIVLGVYDNNAMVGVLTMVYIRNVVVLLTQFTHTDFLHKKPSDLLYHAARMIASKIEGIRFIYAGMASDEKGVNDFKEMRGASLIKSPSYYYINPIASTVLKYFWKQSYRKILGAV